MAAIILGVSGAVILYFAITSMRDLMYSLELKGVSHVTSYIMLASFQTIKDLGVASKTILDSQKSRGVETDGNIFMRVKALVPIMGPLLLGALSSAEEKSIAMDARAFSVDRKHTFLRELRPIPHWEKGIVICIDVMLFATILWSFFIARRV